MNDFQMRTLVEDRQRELRAEADRYRLARQARSSHRSMAATSHATARPQHSRLRLGAILARLGV